MATYYSPTQTTRWLECPTKRALYRDGVRLAAANNRDLAAILGQGVGAGLEAYNLQRFHEEVIDVDAAIAAGQARVAAELTALDAAGRGLDPREAATRDLLPKRVEKALRGYAENDPVPATWRIVDVEKPLNGGGARPDLVVDDGSGPAALDYKTKRELKSIYEAKEWERYRVSWQMLHYTSLLGAARYYICLLVLEPKFRVSLQPFDVPADVMARWRASAERVWAQMAADDAGATPWMAGTHADAYGPCEYVDYCFGNDYDRRRYINVKGAR